MNRHFTRVLVSALLALVMTIGAFAAFTETNTYTDGMFTDVQAKNWFAKDVASAYKLGLMNGMSATTFSPNGNVTVVQGIIMAARANAIINERPAPENSKTGKWYDNYVNYAIEHGIIKEGQFDNYNRNIKRWEMTELFYDAMPAGYYTKQNNVVSIPDVDASAPYAQKILALYNAGIVMGSDDWGTFNPESDIKRSESAAIINRVAIPANRLKKSLKVKPVNEAYVLNYNASFTSNKDYISSGWIYDNRGGAPRNNASGNYAFISDVSTEYGTALIREFNEILGGTITVETTVETNANGVSLEFWDANDKVVYKVKLNGNAWQVLGANGQYTTVMANAFAGAQTKYAFKIVVDLDAKQTTTFINGKKVNTGVTLSDSILNFRFATDEAANNITVMPGTTNIYANYAVLDMYDILDLSAGYGWTVTGNAGIDNEGEMYLKETASAKKTFPAVNGKYIAETYIFVPDGQNASFAVGAGNTAAVKFETKDKKFYANGTEISDAHTNMYHRLHVEADTATGKAEIYINGRLRTTVDLLTKAAVDNITFTNDKGTAKFDLTRVYKKIDHADYVPKPVVAEDNYLVGMNVCNIWRNGEHYGWATITPYDEPKPVLGYYDEGLPETADWEIKFMAEHGVDFQALCLFPDGKDNKKGPLKNPISGQFNQLHDGYMYAEYNDMLDYAIIWESSGNKMDSAALRNYFFPYLMENYFLDKDRYLIIDNKPVLFVFNARTSFPSSIGDEAAVKAELDYLEEYAKSFGFDGMIYISSSDPFDSLALWGFDACAPYNYNTYGSSLDWTKSRIPYNNTNVSKGVFGIPTLSTGFDSMPWHGTRYPNMPLEDWNELVKWTRDVYMPSQKTNEDWQKNMMVLSVWNEFGEGTYINPAGEKGFGYLDGVRKYFTNMPEEHTDHVPTEAQAERINHLYPQYQSNLKRQGYYVGKIDIEDYDLTETFKLTKKNTVVENISGVDYGKDGVTGMTGKNAAQIAIKDEIDVAAAEVGALAINLKAPKGTQFQVMFMVNNDSSFSGANSFTLTSTSDEMTQYLFSTNHKNWTGTLKRIAINPCKTAEKEFAVYSVELYQEKQPLKIYINDAYFDSTILPVRRDDGQVLIPYDPATGITFTLNTLTRWRRFEGEGRLIIEANHHKVEFFVGSEKYKVDGVEKDAGYKIYLEDGIPMLPLKALAEALGYEYSEFNGRYSVNTPQYDFFVENLNTPKEGSWHFNYGTTEGWTSTSFILQPTGSSLYYTSISETNDDPTTMIENLSIPLEKYRAVRIGFKSYDWDTALGNVGRKLTFYYNTSGVIQTSDWKNLCEYWLPSKYTDEFVEYEMKIFDGDYTDVIVKAIRFDPFNGHGTCEIDYIEFVPYEEEAEG